ncbi:hypothetical protein MSPP1_000445 [Malassezia sp. CBS 17886]|nr:hypothetical protein MSPP1_000445 [Malassezia sp. CBS 17886]
MATGPPADARRTAVPPTAALPRVRTEPSLRALDDALALLELLYGAPARADDACRASPDDDPLDAMRADHTERSYAMDWLARILSTELDWLCSEADAADVHERAARLAAGCTQALDSGVLLRDFDFPMPADSIPDVCDVAPKLRVSLTVRDDALPPSDQHSRQGAAGAAAAVGVQTYASSVIMCDLLVRNMAAFWGGEQGSGTGIVGMVAAKILSALGTRGDVSITDYHADVMDNLRYNVKHHLTGVADSVRVVCEPLDWRLLHAMQHPAATAEGEHAAGEHADDIVASRIPPHHSASLVLAADVVYEPRHAAWLLSAIAYLLRLPTTDPCARAHILVPVRTAGRLAGLYRTVDEAIAAQARHLHDGFTLRVHAQRQLPRRRGLGRQDEAAYVWTELAWEEGGERGG